MNDTNMNEHTASGKPVEETVSQLVAATRTCRRFDENRPIPLATLHHLVDMARLSGSSRNCQPWQYMLVNDPELCSLIFPHLGWAGYLHDWKGPQPGEQPVAYILCLLNHNWCSVSEKHAYFDLGIASQSMLLGAASREIMGCRIAAFSPRVEKLFTIPEHLSLELIIALGTPAEEVTIAEMPPNNDVAYWRDDQQVHHVPKRSLQDVLLHLTRK